MIGSWRRVRLGAALLATALLGSRAAAAADAVAVGGWSLAVTSADLVAGAGTDLNSTHESSASAVMLTIYNTPGAWRVSVHRTDTVWPAAFTLAVRRTGPGTGGTVTSGSGASYQTVGTSDTAFFDGSGDVSSIPVQLRLGGMSLRVPPAGYSTTVTYTVITP